MPSQFSNLNFYNGADIAKWKEQCADQRKVAETYPAYDARMSSVDEFGWKLGPWSLRLVLEIWQKPFLWHASAAIFEHIAYETVTIDQGLYKGAKVEVPQDALLALSSWHEEHHEQARFVLNEILGPILRPGDKHQPAEEFDGLWAKHVRTVYTGSRPWLKGQH